MDVLVAALVPLFFMFCVFWLLARLVIPRTILYGALGHLLRDSIIFAIRCAVAIFTLPFVLLYSLLSPPQKNQSPRRRYRQSPRRRRRRHG